MKKFFLFLFAVMALAACQQTIEEEKELTTQVENVKDGMFIHVTSADPHRVLMAFQMAAMVSEDHDVAMYFDIEGVKVLLKDAPDLEYAQFPSSHTQIKNLTAKRITIMACPGCLKAAGYTPDDLMKEISVANKETFFNFTKGRIITLDY
ncbi:MAG: DsrE family protein [Bacteroidales bacterium]|nr:DsrE family protein [Bacteroidales bacterium]